MTLAVGIVTSMFTAILVTRALVNLMFGGRKVGVLKDEGSANRFYGQAQICAGAVG